MKILLDELYKTQEKFGYLPENELKRIATEHTIPEAELYGIISFYTRFYLEPVEKFIIRICKSLSCGINHAGAIKKAVEAHLEHSKDGLFRLEMVECLGQCGRAPAMTINDKVYSELTPEKAVEVLKSYQRGDY